MHPNCRCSTAAYEDSKEYEAWLDFIANGGTTEEWNALKPKYRKKDDEGVFTTFDFRSGDKGRDTIKPRNIANEIKKSQVGADLLKFLEDNEIGVRLLYGGDIPEGRTGVYEPGEIFVYADNTKTVKETALTVIHEATHAKINKPNTKNQELECYKNEYRHQGIVLTDSVIRDIMEKLDRHYTYLEWE